MYYKSIKLLYIILKSATKMYLEEFHMADMGAHIRIFVPKLSIPIYLYQFCVPEWVTVAACEYTE